MSKEGLPIARNSFVQMSKLTNLRGRINYISSHARQENLYAVYETTERKFWRELAKCNQDEFSKSGTEGKCIEARELIIALPESFVDYEPNSLLKLFTEHFKQKYEVECISALHHNKRKTNYHIHLIFSERKLLKEPIEKIATRNMFYNEVGNHVRTKKEISDVNGQIKKGCKIILKGEVYEKKRFTKKDARFKSEAFLEEVKHSYTDLINMYVKNEKEKLSVFSHDSVYLPTKKIGKNNPKAKQIETDNKYRKNWNNTVDRALLSGVMESQIVMIKQTEISNKAKESIQKFGRQPQLFATIILIAITALEHLITLIFKKALQQAEKVEVNSRLLVEDTLLLEPLKVDMKDKLFGDVSEQQGDDLQEKAIIKPPIKSELVSKYPILSDIYQKLENQNYAIYQREQQLSGLVNELGHTEGIFKGKQRRELQVKIEQLKPQIESMKRYLSNIVQGYGYKNVKEFMMEYEASKTDYNNYKKAVSDWEKCNGGEKEPESIKAKLEFHQQKAKELNNNVQYPQTRDRGAR